MRWRWFIAFALLLVVAMTLAVIGFKHFNESLTRGLEEEKSYTRNAMEYHRKHPDKRKGDQVLEVWSDADYIAQSVAKHNSPKEWATWSDKLSFLPENLRKRDGRPYCVINTSRETIVIWFLSGASANCNISSAEDAPHLVIPSGDLEFSGRENYWIYVLWRVQN